MQHISMFDGLCYDHKCITHSMIDGLCRDHDRWLSAEILVGDYLLLQLYLFP